MDSALKVQGRVIYALMMREVHTIYGNTKLGYIWALIQTASQIVIFWIIRTVAHFSPPHGMHIFLFLVIGFGPFMMFRDTVSKCMSAVSGNKALLTFPQVTPVDLMLSRMILLWATELVACTLMTIIGVIFGMPFYITDYGQIFFVFLVSPLLGLGVGMTFASLMVLFPVIDKILPIALKVLFFTSGVFFSVSHFPSNILDWLWYNPMLQLIECGRSAFSRGYNCIDYSIFYILSVTAVFLCLGLLFERHVRGRIKR